MSAFHEVRFPINISRSSKAGPQRQTDVVTLRSGAEQRNTIWADSRRKYNAGYAARSLVDLQSVVRFFEERRGRLYGFRWKDYLDFTSADPGLMPTPIDQGIGVGDGSTATFQLVKVYGGAFAPWVRMIAKPVAGTVRIAVNGVEQALGIGFGVNTTSGVVTFLPGHVPPSNASITAGFEFDVPVRFDTDYLEIDLDAVGVGEAADIPIIEIRP